VRDVLCVNDLVRAFDAVRQNIETTRAEVYNVGGGPENTTSLLELVDEIERLTGKRASCVLDERRAGDQLVYVTDNAKILRHTGWKPETSLKQTIQLLQRFWEENHGMLAQPDVVSAPAVSSFALATELSGRAG
jgi:CDP-paratose 2-epimerase